MSKLLPTIWKNKVKEYADKEFRLLHLDPSVTYQTGYVGNQILNKPWVVCRADNNSVPPWEAKTFEFYDSNEREWVPTDYNEYGYFEIIKLDTQGEPTNDIAYAVVIDNNRKPWDGTNIKVLRKDGWKVEDYNDIDPSFFKIVRKNYLDKISTYNVSFREGVTVHSKSGSETTKNVYLQASPSVAKRIAEKAKTFEEAGGNIRNFWLSIGFDSSLAGSEMYSVNANKMTDEEAEAFNKQTPSAVNPDNMPSESQEANRSTDINLNEIPF